MGKAKAAFIAVVSFFMELLGVLAVPVLLLVGCNLIDYITGLVAAGYRTEEISSYRGFRGIAKKVCMWLLVLIGAWVDILLGLAVMEMRYTTTPMVLLVSAPYSD